jgi:hypothetical protein
MNEKDFEIGQRVQYRSGGNWRPFGVVVEKEPPITMNGAVLVGPHYKVQWDADGEGDVSGWLSYYQLEAVDKTS